MHTKYEVASNIFWHKDWWNNHFMTQVSDYFRQEKSAVGRVVFPVIPSKDVFSISIYKYEHLHHKNVKRGYGVMGAWYLKYEILRRWSMNQMA